MWSLILIQIRWNDITFKPNFGHFLELSILPVVTKYDKQKSHLSCSLCIFLLCRPWATAQSWPVWARIRAPRTAVRSSSSTLPPRRASTRTRSAPGPPFRVGAGGNSTSFIVLFWYFGIQMLQTVFRAQGISWVKGSVWFVLKFAFPPLSPPPHCSANFKTKHAQNLWPTILWPNK